MTKNPVTLVNNAPPVNYQEQVLMNDLSEQARIQEEQLKKELDEKERKEKEEQKQVEKQTESKLEQETNTKEKTEKPKEIQEKSKAKMKKTTMDDRKMIFEKMPDSRQINKTESKQIKNEKTDNTTKIVKPTKPKRKIRIKTRSHDDRIYDHGHSERFKSRIAKKDDKKEIKLGLNDQKNKNSKSKIKK